MKEIWKDVIINDIKPLYEVSSYGRFRNKITGNYLKLTPDKGGYLTIGFSHNKKKQKRFLAHRIVALMFVPNPNPDTATTVNHIDGDKTNNKISNLEWMSNADNVRDMYKHGRHPIRRGVDIPNNKYSESQIHQVCKMLSEGICNKNISINTGVPTNIIGFIKKRALWNHISKNYSFDPPKAKVKYEKYFQLFDTYILEGLSWSDVKTLHGFHGKEVKLLRELFKRRRNKLKLVL